MNWYNPLIPWNQDRDRERISWCNGFRKDIRIFLSILLSPFRPSKVGRGYPPPNSQLCCFLLPRKVGEKLIFPYSLFYDLEILLCLRIRNLKQLTNGVACNKSSLTPIMEQTPKIGRLETSSLFRSFPMPCWTHPWICQIPTLTFLIMKVKLL